MALEERVEAPMTMPGMRTRREMCRASRSRMVVRAAVEWRRSWCGGREGREDVGVEGCRMREVQFLRAASN